MNDEQFCGLTQPRLPPQTQLATPDVGGIQAAQSASLLAVVFRMHVLLMHESVEAAVEVFVHGILLPIKALQVA